MPKIQPYTSPWWLHRLGAELDARVAPMQRLQDYYDGFQPLAMSSQKFRSEFEKLFRAFGDNFCSLVVQAVEERLTVTGFRFGDDEVGARKAWRFWQDNGLDAQSQRAHREAFVKSQASVIVWYAPDDVRRPVIRVQSPLEVAVGWIDDPLRRDVALKRWRAPDGSVFATLYYPDRIEKYEAASQRELAGPSRAPYGETDWRRRQVPGETWPLENPLGVVPVVPIINDPDLDNLGRSELADVLPLQDALNKLLVDMLVASEYGAFRQRWATGLDIPVDPATQKPVEPFKAAVDRLWVASDQDARFGEFGQTDLRPYVNAIETVIQHIASTTRTPPHYLLGQSGSFPSGESLKATETGLVAKARRRMRDFGEAWEEVLRIAMAVSGDSRRARRTDAETIWRDPESRTETQHVDAALKKQALGIPNVQLWEDLDYTPQQIERFIALGAAPNGAATRSAGVATTPDAQEG